MRSSLEPAASTNGWHSFSSTAPRLKKKPWLARREWSIWDGGREGGKRGVGKWGWRVGRSGHGEGQCWQTICRGHSSWQESKSHKLRP